VRWYALYLKIDLNINIKYYAVIFLEKHEYFRRRERDPLLLYSFRNLGNYGVSMDHAIHGIPKAMPS
jgi:hypothetical protein